MMSVSPRFFNVQEQSARRRRTRRLLTGQPPFLFTVYASPVARLIVGPGAAHASADGASVSGVVIEGTLDALGKLGAFGELEAGSLDDADHQRARGRHFERARASRPFCLRRLVRLRLRPVRRSRVFRLYNDMYVT
jgi:hypothetical protein